VRADGAGGFVEGVAVGLPEAVWGLSVLLIGKEVFWWWVWVGLMVEWGDILVFHVLFGERAEVRSQPVAEHCYCVGGHLVGCVLDVVAG